MIACRVCAGLTRRSGVAVATQIWCVLWKLTDSLDGKRMVLQWGGVQSSLAALEANFDDLHVTDVRLTQQAGAGLLAMHRMLQHQLTPCASVDTSTLGCCPHAGGPARVY